MELLGVLNHCGPAHAPLTSGVLQALLTWISSSTSSPPPLLTAAGADSSSSSAPPLMRTGSSEMLLLLLPLMSAACQCLASTSHLSRVLEACCDAYFSSSSLTGTLYQPTVSNTICGI